MRPFKDLSASANSGQPLGVINGMQLTDRRIYFTWADARRREDITLFEDAENSEELPPPPIPPILDIEYEALVMHGLDSGCSFTKLVPLGADRHIVFIKWKWETGLSHIP